MASGVGLIVRGTGDTELIPVEDRDWSSLTTVPVDVVGNVAPTFVTALGVNPLRAFPSTPPVTNSMLGQSSATYTGSTATSLAAKIGEFENSGPYRIVLSIAAGASAQTNMDMRPYIVIATTSTSSAGAINDAFTLGWNPGAQFLTTNLYSPYAAFTSIGEDLSFGSNYRVLSAGYFALRGTATGLSDYTVTSDVIDVPFTTSKRHIWVVFFTSTNGFTVSFNSRFQRLGE